MTYLFENFRILNLCLLDLKTNRFINIDFAELPFRYVVLDPATHTKMWHLNALKSQVISSDSHMHIVIIKA